MSSVACAEFRDGYHYWKPAAIVFGDCVYTVRDYMSLGIGVLSILIWLVALVPQAVANIRTGKVEGQSVWFWILWILGDILNFTGCILAHQLPSQTALALVYLFMTLVLFFQFIYYAQFTPKSIIQEQANAAIKPIPALGIRSPMLVQGLSPLTASSFKTRKQMQRNQNESQRGRKYKTNRSSDQSWMRSRSLTQSPEPEKHDENSIIGRPVKPYVFGGIMFLSFSGWGWVQVSRIDVGRRLLDTDNQQDLVGIVLGWTMTMVYFSSRFPQMVKMLKDEQIEGVSKSMFVMTFSGNLTYCAAVLIRSLEWEYLLSKLPWLVDGLGTMVQDLAILILYSYLERKHNHKHKKLIIVTCDETQPLLAQSSIN